MAISAELLEMMVCPACRENLELKSDNSGLKCLGCRRVYPIRDEIPVMIIEDAVME